MFDLTKSKVDNMSDEELKAIKNKEKCYEGPITGNINVL